MTSWSRMAIWIGTASAVTVGVAISAAAPGVAQDAQVIRSVALQGQAVVGSTLTAVVDVSDPAAVIEYRWQRCASDRKSCDRIQRAQNAASYTIAPVDLGNRLALRAVTEVGGMQQSQWSPLTDVVTTAGTPVPTPTPTPTPAPTPAPTPEPTPSPTPTPSPSTTPNRNTDPPAVAPTFDQSGRNASAPIATANPAPPAAEALPYLRPFPVVRVRGTLVPGGARISLLRIRAPTTARVAVRCKGPSCRLRKRSFGSGRVAALERYLRAGTRITIRVSKPNAVGKYVRLAIRDGSPPKRRDRCLLPGGTEPAACPPT